MEPIVTGLLIAAGAVVIKMCSGEGSEAKHERLKETYPTPPYRVKKAVGQINSANDRGFELSETSRYYDPDTRQIIKERRDGRITVE